MLLDGTGSSGEVRDWARATARRLVRAAAKEGAERSLRAVHSAIAAAILSSDRPAPTLPAPPRTPSRTALPRSAPSCSTT